jgi:DNA-binding winged helix-turn-helix (wHTH) protein/tetratricopeptide (TPR) repeat protein
MASQLGTLLRFEGYSIDTSRWTLSWNDEPISLTRKSFDLLLYLIERRDRVVGKDAILDDLWPKQVVESSNLTQQIFLLRRALSRHESGRDIIQTVAGRGYRFVAHIDAPAAQPDRVNTIVFHEQRSVTRVSVEEDIDDGVEEPVVETARPRVETSRHRIGLMANWASKKRVALLAPALIALAVAPFAWRYWQNRSAGPPVELVLADFEDNSGDASLGVALNDAIRIDLAQSPFVTVLPAGKVRATLVTMRQPPNTPVTPALAREVCERNSAQVLLQGSLSKFGQRYLVSLRASSCLSGDVLAEDKDEIERQDDLPEAFDRLAAKIRRSLGESRASISRFDKPLFPSHTGSIAALRAYSEGRRLYNRGDWAGSLSLFQHAVELDPEFATAYLHIASVYYNFKDLDHEREALKKAYALQDALTESNRLYLSAVYHHEVTGDLYQSLNTYKAWVALYPNDKSAWGNLATAYDDLGQAALGIAPAQRTLDMDPAIDAAYQNLASVQLHSGQPAAALQTCQLAIDRHLDNESLRDLMLQITYAQHDAAGVQAQLAWSRDHDRPLSLRVDEILLAVAAGKIHLAEELTRSLNDALVPPERTAERASSLWQISRALAEEGYTDPSAAILKSQATATPDENSLVALVEDGDPSQAEETLRQIMKEHGHETLWKDEKAPEVTAAILLAQHKPREAVAALQPASAFEGLTSGPAYLRGRAYRALNEDDLALAEFTKIIRSPYIDPLSSRYSLAQLEMARIYAEKKDTAQARAHYQRFIEHWQSADPDAPLLIAAERESAELPSDSH